MRVDQVRAVGGGAGTRGWFAPGALLLALTVLVYLPSLGTTYVWDDDNYLINNPTLRVPRGLVRIWTEPRASPQYYPLVFSTFWVEYHLWGLWYPGYHAVNALVHALNALLLWGLLRRMAVPGAWLAAAVFALHPVHVESVAWITERKNVLSAAFYFAAMLAYLRFAPPVESEPAARGARRWYALALVLYVAALWSKTVTCSLPAVLLLLHWWKRGGLEWRDVRPLAPFFAVGLYLGLQTAWLERYHVGTIGLPWEISPLDRSLIAGRALWFYAGKLGWPSPLIFMYPRWRIDAGAWWQYTYPLAALATLVALWKARHRIGRGPFASVAFFALTLFPALGFIDTAPMRYSFVADHFQYLASVGLITLFAALGTMAARRLPSGCPWPRTLVTGGLLLVLGTLTVRQGFAYGSPWTLWADTLAKDPNCWMARNNLGMLLIEQGRPDEAERQLAAAVRDNPDCAEAQVNLGCLLQARGERDEAEAHFRRALVHSPRFWPAHFNLGLIASRRGDHDAAIGHFRAALKSDSRSAESQAQARAMLALSLARRRRP
jgi:protein O-mannosyl-transferase